ncbi:hypothetical protein MPTK1_1g13360 [Marchantia polymorpha subsp. ruderalis]|uniref:Isopenicillin N synthase-like Fe(2+) 2OG dioxygenase domain-containing protein n=2 Tax=Marchantia polymorpha TaxID=3197 RepID=A0AAF6APP9_MARPO|nr:hypothetical protein MARPO_0019s0106 [Marchantia polymorpha]BBM98419.1 hypothetical protein Mp_1g13360 [Marchantia polymorpha subsp. ruderalis]|eukprot:PTQ44689.1 hypothetical protein MARPO_0019s0106 [Marchantia polymorpha]
MMELPVIDLEEYLLARGGLEENGDAGQEFLALCQEVANCLRDTGALVIRDPRCTTEDNDRFLDMMEKYWSQSDAFKRQQERPDVFYQVGVTPEGIETPRCLFDQSLQERMNQLSEDARPHVPSGADPKWRYMWRFGPRPSNTGFQELSSDPVIPEGFPEWRDTLNDWGRKMISAVEVVAEMAATGFGLPQTTFTSLMKEGPHLLAPTGCDLSKYGKKGTVFAGYHYDLNFLTIHGRSRFPGLFIWLKDGRKVPVSVPPGCLLLQAGKELEWLTGGECSAGMHEVVVTDKTLAAVEAARKEGRSLWRVSSTVFGHIAYDAVLQPLGHFADAPRAHLYSPIVAGEYVKSELSVIKLKGKKIMSAQVAPLSSS